MGRGTKSCKLFFFNDINENYPGVMTVVLAKAAPWFPIQTSEARITCRKRVSKGVLVSLHQGDLPGTVLPGGPLHPVGGLAALLRHGLEPTVPVEYHELEAVTE
jgi:hypothetical protein